METCTAKCCEVLCRLIFVRIDHVTIRVECHLLMRLADEPTCFQKVLVYFDIQKRKYHSSTCENEVSQVTGTYQACPKSVLVAEV